MKLELKRTLLLIFGGLAVCIIFPLIFKLIVFKPILSILVTNNNTNDAFAAVLNTAVLIFSYKLFYQITENRRIMELQINKLPYAIVIGSTMGIGIISLVILILFLFNMYSVMAVSGIGNVLMPLLLFILIGIWEEIIFRGIIHRIIEQNFGFITAIIISPLIFGFVHFSNTGFDFLAGISVTLELGLLTGLIFSITKNLWYPVFLHISWNFSFVIYGVNVSGANEYTQLIESKLSGPAIFTGGEFGPESSLITILISVVLGVFLFVKKNMLNNIFAKSDKNFGG